MGTAIPVNRACFDASTAAEATGGRIARRRTRRTQACGITTDSRAVTPGSAFIALRGERHDGHTFVSAAVAAGAVLVLVEQRRGPTRADVDVVEVGDTLSAWGCLARAHLRAWRRARERACVVAITGSAGKTTTKEMCARLLQAVAKCHATLGNLNNRVGLPAVVLGVEPEHRFLVLEMGMSETGEIAALGAIAEPDVSLITNVGLAHAGGVGGTVDDVACEKGAIFAAVRADGSIVANADDAAVMARARTIQGKKCVTFGRAVHADVCLASREVLGIASSRVAIDRRGRRAWFDLPIAGEAAAMDFTAALATAEAAAGPIDDAVVTSVLHSVVPLAGRMNVYRAGSVVILDDAYNANPASVRSALATLAETGRLGEQGAGRVLRRVAILGEMKELGPMAEREHAAIGEAVAAAGVSLLVSCGGLADAIALAAERRGVQVVLALDATEAARAAIEHVRPGDAVLVKASRGVGAERVVEALAANARTGDRSRAL
jgi:UDP-N-acetylmuramoyl-tripeptide--D-alanyl-D-alanine ligase